MKSSSPLLWICLAVAAVLSALALLDPGGIYAAYGAELPGGTPAVARVFSAAQDGLFPWSSPAPPASDPAAPDPARPDPPAPLPAETDAAASPADASVSSEPDPRPAQEEEPSPLPPAFAAVDTSYFDDALFLGDSRIEGLSLYGRLPNAAFYWQRGLTVWSVMEKAFVSEGGGKLTVPQALSRRSFGKIYLMLGVNELGKGTTESFAAQYGVVVDTIRRLQPDAVIYIQAIFHVTQEKSQTSIYRNDVIDARNEAVSRFADGVQVFYLDCNPAFDGEDGALIPDYTGDGVHLMSPYYVLWRDYLLAHAIVRDAPAAAPAEEDAVEAAALVQPAPAQEVAPPADDPAEEEAPFSEDDRPEEEITLNENDPASD